MGVLLFKYQKGEINMNLSELYKNNQKLNDLRQKLHDAYKSNDENAVTDTFL